MRSEIAQNVRARRGDDIVKRIGNSHDAGRRRGIPNVVSEKRDGLVTEALTAGMSDKLVSDVVKLLGVHMIVAVKRGDDNVFNWKMIIGDVLSKSVASIGKIRPLADNFTW